MQDKFYRLMFAAFFFAAFLCQTINALGNNKDFEKMPSPETPLSGSLAMFG